MSRTRIALWSPDSGGMTPGRPNVRIRVAEGCARKDYRRDRPASVRYVVRVETASRREIRHVPSGGPRNFLRAMAVWHSTRRLGVR